MFPLIELWLRHISSAAFKIYNRTHGKNRKEANNQEIHCNKYLKKNNNQDILELTISSNIIHLCLFICEALWNSGKTNFRKNSLLWTTSNVFHVIFILYLLLSSPTSTAGVHTWPCRSPLFRWDPFVWPLTLTSTWPWPLHCWKLLLLHLCRSQQRLYLPSLVCL